MARVLAVDDDDLVTEFYKALLSEAGYEVETAADATAAVIVYRKFKPDLLILDAEMPGGGGEKVFGVARELVSSGLPVIFITGLPERVGRIARENPQTLVFKKPIKSVTLLSAVAGMLGPRP